VCGSVRKRGYNRFKFIEYTFFYYYYYYFYIFTPIDISRSLRMRRGNHIVVPVLYPSRRRLHIIGGASCLLFRVSTEIGLLYFSDFVSTRFGFVGLLRFFFLFIALVEIRIKQAQLRSRAARRRDGQLQQHLPVCRDTLLLPHPLTLYTTHSDRKSSVL